MPEVRRRTPRAPGPAATGPEPRRDLRWLGVSVCVVSAVLMIALVVWLVTALG